MARENFDFVIVGAGIVGLTIAYELKKREPTASIAVLEKEATPGLHARGATVVYYTVASTMTVIHKKPGFVHWVRTK